MDFQNLEALIAFAIEKEKEAANFYEENSESEMMSGTKQMLKEFAAEERKHQQMLEDFLATGIAENLDGYRFEWITDIKRSYNELLDKANSDGAKKLFKMLCQEEAKHKLALETLYDEYMAKMGD
ncbi:MAG: rubrerythrin [Desulfosarcina sp.]|nr:rubrerythrin [Desulfosarcina sp.]